mmetsp:Transcript_3785/g.6442  ORF Transcript_3785/g.6442 Transcript_3785/m.6442 type:complete len:228 (-) Transcript_3785:3470-4153(-)
MIINMSRLAALLKQHLCALKTHRRILFWNEIGTNREHDGEGVRIRLDIRLRVQPLEDTERHLKSFLAVHIMLGESTCVHDGIGGVNIRLNIRVFRILIKIPEIGQNRLGSHRSALLSRLGPSVNDTSVGPRVRLEALVTCRVPLLHNAQDLFSPRSRTTVTTLRKRIDQSVVSVGVRLHINVSSLVKLIHVIEDLLGPLRTSLASAPSPGIDNCIECDRVRLNIGVS